MTASEIVIDRLLDVVIPRIRDEVNLHLNSKKESRTLSLNLSKIKLLLEYAERNQLRDRRIKVWLEELQGVAYDVEDVLDDWDSEIPVPLSDSEKSESKLTIFEKVRHSIPSPYSSYKRLIKNRTIAQEIKDLNEMIEEIYNKGGNELNLLHILPSEKEGMRCNRITRTSSDFIKSRIHGRKSDKEKIKAMVLGFDNKQTDTVHIISIVGQGGLGKTTLAKMVYDDEDVKSEFPERIWVCVSDPFDEITVSKKILEQLEGHYPNVFGLETVSIRIKNSLRKKQKFLLVLDDAWTEDHTKWEPLVACLSHGAEGSKILVTTRKRNTAETLGSTQVYLLQPMTHEDCWSIISHLALSRRNGSQFEKCGKEIAKKCDGLPLAAHFLGGLLRNKKSVQEWRRVLESGIWELENVENNIFRHFSLSYDELDSATKRCFSYCAIFPKDFNINVKKLIRMWMAQGFLSSSTGDLEEHGERIFYELSQHSFFQDFQKDCHLFSDDGVVTCKMHDIVHDFAQYLTKNECVLVEGIDRESSKRSSFGSARHLSWLDKDKPETLVSSLIPNAKKLRTFFCMNSLPLNFLCHLKYVRELIISHCFLRWIPEEIENMIHLRYLDLSDNGYMHFTPETIFNLCNLQTLNLSGNSFRDKLPQGISKLKSLRHFSMQEIMLSQGLQGLTNVRTLMGDIVTRKGDNNLGCLRNLNLLEGLLCIRLEGLDEDADVNEAKSANLVQKKFMHSLSLKYDHKVRLEVVEALQPNLELLCLSISGLVLPSWITAMENLRKLEIGGVSSKLPPLGRLQHLEILYFKMLDMQYVGDEFLGLKQVDARKGPVVAFPSLKTLEFQGCIRWVEWQDISEEEDANKSIIIMPHLKHLKFNYCLKLKVLPHRLLQRLSNLSLQTLECKLCTALLIRFGRAKKLEDVLYSMPNITFTI